jgi:hypothetical protein
LGKFKKRHRYVVSLKWCAKIKINEEEKCEMTSPIAFDVKKDSNYKAKIKFRKNSPIKPVNNQIFLMEAYVAGIAYVPNAGVYIKNLTTGTKLKLCREYDNQHDIYAILVKDKSGNKLGYVPCEANNGLIARLIDAGKRIYATVSGLKTSGYNTDNPMVRKPKEIFSINIKIFMDDSKKKLS